MPSNNVQVNNNVPPFNVAPIRVYRYQVGTRGGSGDQGLPPVGESVEQDPCTTLLNIYIYIYIYICIYIDKCKMNRNEQINKYQTKTEMS